MTAVLTESAPPARIVVRPRELRPGRGTGRQARPQARPARPLAAPRLDPTISASPSACRVVRPAPEPVQTARRSSWRLTERGIALVLATGLAIAAAALVVVGLTAMRVTGESFQSGRQLSAIR